ncbi:TRAP transporter small permease [Pseudooceanicola aestuarii]|uniref:TRAP transporter small permease n=1 Tax=Pseudooceanicola aestuarii TaxID=2697319 RepID=UPI0013D0EE37|nr:TRAP transporter small permease [Pseudooceanicola aestuarii]
MGQGRDAATLHWAHRAQDGLARLCIFVTAVALVTLVATFGWLVFGRYVLNVTPTWVEQLALLLVCYITFLGAGVGMHEQTHLGVTVFRDMLPRRPRKVALLVIDVILALFGLCMLLTSLQLFRFGWDTLLPMLDIPESFRTLSAVLCGGLILVFCGLRAMLRLSDMVRGTNLVIEREEDI